MILKKNTSRLPYNILLFTNNNNGDKRLKRCIVMKEIIKLDINSRLMKITIHDNTRFLGELSEVIDGLTIVKIEVIRRGLYSIVSTSREVQVEKEESGIIFSSSEYTVKSKF
jgi:hypothetical protein